MSVRPPGLSSPVLCAPLAVAGCMSPSEGVSRRVETAIDSLVADAMARRHVPGLGVAVVQGGTVVCARGYGRVGASDSHAAVDTATIFGLGSIDKTVSAAIAPIRGEGCVAPG